MLDQIEENIERSIESAVHFSNFSAINKTSGFANLWEVYNKIIAELREIDSDFFNKLERLDFPKPRKMKLFMKDKYYGQYLGEQVLPLLEALRKVKVLVESYKKR
jgi:hypothetical protein